MSTLLQALMAALVILGFYASYVHNKDWYHKTWKTFLGLGDLFKAKKPGSAHDPHHSGGEGEAGHGHGTHGH